MPEAGWLYVLEIPALPGVVKIGRTSRDPTLRCRELGGADCPFVAPLAVDMNAPGREIEGPMAAVILGGLMTSMILNLFVLPILAVRFGKFSKNETNDIENMTE